MNLRGVCRVVLFAVVFAMALLVADAPLVAGEPDPSFSEMIAITVDCDTASVSVTLMVSSDDYTLVGFPGPVDMSGSHLEDAVGVYVLFYPDSSILWYAFEGISEGDARANADAVTDSINDALAVSFTWNWTESVDSEVYVDYTGAGQPDMASFAGMMVQACVGVDVDGFSDALPSLADQTIVSYLVLGASRESVVFDWETGIGLVSSSSIPTGTDSHTIDVLSLLGVLSLAPSQYSFVGGICESMVVLNISSTDSIYYDSCEPGITEDPSQRGWWVMFEYYPWAAFYFGSDSSPVAPLTFTFGGTVVPEFTPLTLIITLILTAACIIAFRKRVLRKNRSPA